MRIVSPDLSGLGIKESYRASSDFQGFSNRLAPEEVRTRDYRELPEPQHCFSDTPIRRETLPAESLSIVEGGG
jgi:hypothetical protein